MEPEPTGATARGIAWTALSFGSRQVLQVAVTLVLARLLRPQDFGLVAMAVIAVNLFGLVRDLGLGAALVQRQTLRQAHSDAAFWTNLAAGVLLTSALCALAVPLSWFFEEPRLVGILLVLAPSMLFSSLSVVPTALLARSGGFRTIATREMVSAALGGALSIGLAFSGFGPYSLVVQTLVTSLFSTVFLWSSVPWRPGWTFDRDAFGDLLSYGLPLAGSNLVNFAARNVDSLLIGRFLGAAALGVYGLAYSFVMLFMNTAYSVVGRVLFPRLSRLQEDDAAMRSEYVASVRELATVAYLPLALTITLAPDIVSVVLGARWEPAVLPVQVFALVAMGQLVGTTAGWIYNARARTRLQFLVGLGVTLLVLVGVSVGLRWGLAGVALGYLTASYVGAYPFLRIPYQLIGLRVRTVLAALGPVLLAAAAAVAASYAVREALLQLTGADAVLRLASGTAIGAAAYVAVLLVLRPTIVGELAAVIRSLRARPEAP